ncbi:MAG: uridine kinase [Clostridia bacterium]|nr:uridine kinase [Clostridia bacterium]
MGTLLRYDGWGSLGPLTDLLDRASADRPLVLALDGFCASGKSTLAAEFEKRYGARVIHTDDFYLPSPMRTPERYAEPGGTIQYERLKEEVVDCLRLPALTYGRIRHADFTVGDPVTLPLAPLTVIEGAYAAHPFFGDYADILCFMETEPGEQRRRIFARNGPERLRLFEERWIPYEEKYEAAFGIREKADFIILT